MQGPWEIEQMAITHSANTLAPTQGIPCQGKGNLKKLPTIILLFDHIIVRLWRTDLRMKSGRAMRLFEQEIVS